MNLDDRIPASSITLLEPLLKSYKGLIRISKPRKSKLGDFKVSPKGCSISINADLSPEAFLVTLLHELAHYEVWKNHGNSVMPHGMEWKNTYKRLLSPFLVNAVFSSDVQSSLLKYMDNPKASSCADVQLFQALNKDKGATYVSEIDMNERFFYPQKGEFIMIKKRRTRYLCIQINSGKNYIFHPSAQVFLNAPKH